MPSYKLIRGWLLIAIVFSLLSLYPIAAAQEPTTLSIVWMTSPSDSAQQHDVIVRFAREFEDFHENVAVQIQFVDWSEGRETLLEQVRLGTPPDLAVIGARWVPEFVSLGLIEPLDSFLTHDFTQRFVPSIINEGTVYVGRTFGLPVSTSTRALYYNKDILAAAGITEPPETWDELLRAGQAVNALNMGAYGFGLQGGDGLETNTYFYYFVWGNGGNLYNADGTMSALDQPPAVEAVAFLKRMIDENATQPDPTSEAYDRRNKLEAGFMDGTLSMIISGPWLIGQLRSAAPDINFGIAPIPYHTTPATYGVIDSLVMLSTSPHKELAWAYLEHLYDESRRQEYLRVSGLLPELVSLLNDPAFTEDQDFRVFLTLLPDARFEPLHTQSEAISRIVIDAIRAVYLGGAEPQQSMYDASQAVDQLLTTSVAAW